MITRRTETRFFIGDTEYRTLAQAQLAWLEELAKANGGNLSPELILREKDAVVDILTTTPRSLPRARAVNGGRKVRKARKAESTTDDDNRYATVARAQQHCTTAQA